MLRKLPKLVNYTLFLLSLFQVSLAEMDMDILAEMDVEIPGLSLRVVTIAMFPWGIRDII